MPTFVFDDYYGDQRANSTAAVPTYLPAAGQWDPIGGTCPGCTTSTNLPIIIDPTKAQNGTWHTTTVSPGEPETTISITFNGTGVSAYCLLPPNFGNGITSYMNMTFTLDGKLVGQFERTADTDQWTYNHSVFSTSGLENKEHTFVLSPRGDVDTSYLVFDYFTYDYEGPPPSPSSSAVSGASSTQTESGSMTGITSAAPTSSGTPAHDKAPSSSHTSAGAIAGGVIAGVAALALAAFAFWFFVHRRSARRMGDKIIPQRGYSLDLEERNMPPPPMPFMVGMSEVGYSDMSSSADALISRPADTMGGSAAGSSVLSSSVPSALPASVDEKRALQEASLKKMHEMEQRIAGGSVVDAYEDQSLRGEIDTLRSQVAELTAALRLQTEGTRDQSTFEEPPPSYDAGPRRP